MGSGLTLALLITGGVLLPLALLTGYLTYKSREEEFSVLEDGEGMGSINLFWNKNKFTILFAITFIIGSASLGMFLGAAFGTGEFFSGNLWDFWG